MPIQLNLAVRRLFPFILFRSLGQLTFWLATIVAYAGLASLFLNKGELLAGCIGGAIVSLFAWIPLLPYELRIQTPDTRASLVRITGFLLQSKLTRTNFQPYAEIGIGEWTTELPWWRTYKGNEVSVSVDGNTVLVCGPRSMIKPLWRSFRGP